MGEQERRDREHAAMGGRPSDLRPPEPSEGAILAAEQAYKDGPDDESQFDAIRAALRAAYSVDFGDLDVQI
jgi:hypothetical protein